MLALGFSVNKSTKFNVVIPASCFGVIFGIDAIAFSVLFPMFSQIQPKLKEHISLLMHCITWIFKLKCSKGQNNFIIVFPILLMSPSDDSDEQVKIGADLLLKGWVMLNRACPTCYQPLYQKQDRIICVKCKQDYILVNSPSEIPQQQRKEAQDKATPASTSNSSLQSNLSAFDFSSLPPTLVDTAKILLEKIENLNIQLKETTDPIEITEISNSIRSLVDSLHSLIS